MHKRLIAGALIALIFSYCSLFVPSSSKLYKRSLKKHPQYDAVIVPGVPFYAPQWDKPMLMRVIWSVHLYKRGLTKNIIMSGAAVYSPYVEAQIMKQYAVALGVPADHVFVEDKALHSTENVWYGFLLAKKLGFKTVAICSDPFQTRLLHRFAKKRTKGVEFLPTLFDTLRTLSHDTPVIEYEHLKLDTTTFIPLPQRESKWKRLRGTWGKNINYKDTVY
jgi:uncharacterized SAM-binding protein YcdF (DUF218 family)